MAGVIWPTNFAKALDAMSLFSFDFDVMAGFMCLVDMSFYQSLLSTTLALVVVVLTVAAYSVLRSASNPQHAGIFRREGIFFVVYLLLFAYPAVSVKVVETFAW